MNTPKPRDEKSLLIDIFMAASTAVAKGAVDREHFAGKQLLEALKAYDEFRFPREVK